MKRNEKLLVISHTPFSQHSNNGKTFTALFDFLDSKNIAQLYFNNSTPSFKICENYYKISDSDIIKKFYFRKKTMHIINKDDIEHEDQFIPNSPNQFIRKISKSNFMRIFRDLWWRKYTLDDELLNWIKLFNPTKVLVVVGGDIFSVKLANQILEQIDGVDSFLFFTDDYLLNKKKDKSLLNWLYGYNKKYFKNFYSLQEKTNGTFVISDKMKEVYKEELNTEIWVVMNNVTPKKKEYIRINNETLKIAYFGGLSIKRNDAISNLCDIFEKNKIKADIDIYTSASNYKLIPETRENKYAKIVNKGFIEGSTELANTMQEYDFLLHIESHDRKMLNLSKYSISTKIPEYLNEKKPIITYGPRNQASIEYLLKEGASFHIDTNISKSELALLFDNDYLNELVSNYEDIVKKNHDKTIQQELIRTKIGL